MTTNVIAYLAIFSAIISVFYSVLIHSALHHTIVAITGIFQ